MQRFTASDAKQRFGDLLEAAARGPVAIERHKTVRAIVCSPEVFESRAGGSDDRAAILAQRQAARVSQQLVEKDRLIKHHQVALQLLQLPVAQRQRALLAARHVVHRWAQERLCSTDYIQRWEHILSLPVAQMVQAMCDEQDPWSPALRQNSPWPVVDLSALAREGTRAPRKAAAGGRLQAQSPPRAV